MLIQLGNLGKHENHQRHHVVNPIHLREDRGVGGASTSGGTTGWGGVTRGGLRLVRIQGVGMFTVTMLRECNRALYCRLKGYEEDLVF